MDTLNALLPWLIDHYPQVAGYTVAILITGFVTVFLCRRLLKVDALDKAIAGLATKTDVAAVQVAVTKIEPSLQEVRERFIKVEDRVETLWRDKLAPAASPRQLNERGRSILESSGVKDVINGMSADFLTTLRSKNPATAYDAESLILDIVSNLPKTNPELLPKLKDGAFRTGVDIDALLFVAGIHLRDLIFKDLGFDLTDIDSQVKS